MTNLHTLSSDLYAISASNIKMTPEALSLYCNSATHQPQNIVIAAQMLGEKQHFGQVGMPIMSKLNPYLLIKI